MKFDIGATTYTTLHEQENINLLILKQNELFERGIPLSQWACIQQCWNNDGGILVFWELWRKHDMLLTVKKWNFAKFWV